MGAQSVVIVIAVVGALIAVAGASFLILAGVGSRWRDVCEERGFDDASDVDA